MRANARQPEPLGKEGSLSREAGAGSLAAVAKVLEWTEERTQADWGWVQGKRGGGPALILEHWGCGLRQLSPGLETLMSLSPKWHRQLPTPCSVTAQLRVWHPGGIQSPLSSVISIFAYYYYYYSQDDFKYLQSSNIPWGSLLRVPFIQKSSVLSITVAHRRPYCKHRTPPWDPVHGN